MSPASSWSKSSPPTALWLGRAAVVRAAVCVDGRVKSPSNASSSSDAPAAAASATVAGGETLFLSADTAAGARCAAGAVPTVDLRSAAKRFKSRTLRSTAVGERRVGGRGRLPTARNARCDLSLRFCSRSAAFSSIKRFMSLLKALIVDAQDRRCGAVSRWSGAQQARPRTRFQERGAAPTQQHTEQKLANVDAFSAHNAGTAAQFADAGVCARDAAARRRAGGRRARAAQRRAGARAHAGRHQTASVKSGQTRSSDGTSERAQQS